MELPGKTLLEIIENTADWDYREAAIAMCLLVFDDDKMPSGLPVCAALLMAKARRKYWPTSTILYRFRELIRNA